MEEEWTELIVFPGKNLRRSGKDFTYRCCGKKFTDETKLKCHLRDYHDIGGRLHNCTKCNKYFKTKFRLKKHMLDKHTVKGNFHCTQCFDILPTKYELDDHMQKYHDIWYTCPHCTKRPKTKQNLRSHIWCVHNIGGQWYICAHCNKRFKTKNNRDVHLQKYHIN